MPFENSPVGSGHIAKSPRSFMLHDQSIVQAAGPLEDRPTTTEAPKDRYAARCASGFINFGYDSVRMTQNNKIALRLPDSQDGIRFFLFAPVKKRFVACKIVRRIGVS